MLNPQTGIIVSNPKLENIYSLEEDGIVFQGLKLFLWGNTVFHFLSFHLSVCDILFL